MIRALIFFVAINLPITITLSDVQILDEYKVTRGNNFIKKDRGSLKTICIDGYKFVVLENQILQFYENKHGLPMPSKCFDDEK